MKKELSILSTVISVPKINSNSITWNGGSVCTWVPLFYVSTPIKQCLQRIWILYLITKLQLTIRIFILVPIILEWVINAVSYDCVIRKIEAMKNFYKQKGSILVKFQSENWYLDFFRIYLDIITQRSKTERQFKVVMSHKTNCIKLKNINKRHPQAYLED